MTKRVALAALIAFVLLVAAPHAAFAKSYSMRDVEIEAVVAPDGSLDVVEHRTFDFDGDFTFVSWELDLGHAENLTVLGFAGPDGEYVPTDDPLATDTRPPDTYLVERYPGGVKVTAFFRISSQPAIFTLRYRVAGGAVRWQDTAELYWKFIGDRSELPVRGVRIHIVPPPGVARPDVRAWAHGPLTGDVVINDDASVDLTLDGLPEYTFVEARVLYPAGALSGASARPDAMLETILREEDRWAREANAERAKARAVVWGAIVLGALAPLGALAFTLKQFFRHGKEYKPSFAGEYYRELPADLTPALVGALMKMGKPDDDDMTATLLDLIDRGVIAIERTTAEKRGLFGIPTGEEETYRLALRREQTGALSAHERLLVEHLFDATARADSFTMAELRAVAKNQAAAERYLAGVTKWREAVEREMRDRHLLERGGTGRVALHIGIGVLSAIAVVLLAFAAESWYHAVIGMPAAAATIILGTKMERRSPDAAELHAKYEGVRNYLKDFGRMQEKPPGSVVLWRHFLVLAVVFGIADEVLAALRVKAPEVLQDQQLGTWYWLSTASSSGGLSPMRSLSAGMVSVAKVASSHNSSSSGGGGGFSGGGGGGGGGGGVSAG